MATERHPAFSELHGYFVKDAYAREALAELTTEFENTKYFVTPQMFGAKADGETNDSTAIQAAIDSGLPVIFPQGTYKIAETIDIHDKKYFTMDAMNATIVYTGDEYAFDFIHIVSSNIKFGEIRATAGGCLKFSGSTSQEYSQYNNFEFRSFKATTNCIYVHQTGTCWINENRWYNGRFETGENGVYIYHDSTTNNISHWNFFNVGAEGVAVGFNLNNISGMKIAGFTFIGFRFVECPLLFKTSGNVKEFSFYGNDWLGADKFDIGDENTTDWLITSAQQRAVYRIINGVYHSGYRRFAPTAAEGVTLADTTCAKVNDGVVIVNTRITVAENTAAFTTLCTIEETENKPYNPVWGSFNGKSIRIYGDGTIKCAEALNAGEAIYLSVAYVGQGAHMT